MKYKDSLSVAFAILAAALYAISAPASKLLLEKVEPTMMAALLYLGAGIGMLMLGLLRRGAKQRPKEASLSKQELPYTIGMIALDIAAPILLMLGLTMTTSANVSLLNNFEIVATALIARLVFREAIGKRLWLAIGLITFASVLLSFEDWNHFHISVGAFFVLLACVCWGIENNCTRMMSDKDPLEIVVIKGFGSGLGSLLIAFAIGEKMPDLFYIPVVLLLGFVAYGLSIFFYVHAQRRLGAARTSAFYAVAPFIGVALSFFLFRAPPGSAFAVALVIMILGAYLASTQQKK